MAVSQEERDYVRLLHMRDEANRAIEFSKGQTRRTLDQDRMERRALEMCIELIGVISSRMSSAFRDAHPEIRWEYYIDLGDHLLQEYKEVDLDRLWDTVQISLPILIAELNNLLPPETDDENNS